MSEIEIENEISEGFSGLGSPGIGVGHADSESYFTSARDLIIAEVRRHPFLLDVYLITPHPPETNIHSSRRFSVPSWQGTPHHGDHGFVGRGVSSYTPTASVRDTGCNSPPERDYVNGTCPPNRPARSSPTQCNGPPVNGTCPPLSRRARSSPTQPCVPSLLSRT